MVSEYQFVVNNPGQLTTGYVQESYYSCFHGGTLYNDSATDIIWFRNQVSLGANEKVSGKDNFKQWLWEQSCVEISHMYSNNSIIASDKLCLDCDNKHQEQYFSGVLSQHQNTR